MTARRGTWLRRFASAAAVAAAGSAWRPATDPPVSATWKGAVRTACRFGAVYGGLYCLTTPQVYLALRGGGLGRQQAAADAWARLWEVRPVREWMSVHVLGTELGDRFHGGDDAHTWAGQLCWLAGAAVVTPIWSALDRRRDGTALAASLRLVLRFCLAGQMFSYGAAKAVPIQFPSPSPSQLVEPLGHLSPMGLLWAHTGSSTPYQVLLGVAEIVGGLLLVVPRTASLGGVVCAAEMAQVLALNLAFDVPVKVHASHLSLLGLLVLAPDAPRLAGALLTGRPVAAAATTDLFRSRRANRIATAVQVGAGLCLLGAHLRNAWSVWKDVGGGRPRPELHGVWDVTDVSVDGAQGSPVPTDDGRWRRLAVDSADVVAVQRADDSVERCAAVIDMETRTLLLTSMARPDRPVVLTFERPADDRLSLEGDLDGGRVRMELRRRDRDTFPLVSHRFRLVQDRSSLR